MKDLRTNLLYYVYFAGVAVELKLESPKNKQSEKKAYCFYFSWYH